jgi:hypothetical protein
MDGYFSVPRASTGDLAIDPGPSAETPVVNCQTQQCLPIVVEALTEQVRGNTCILPKPFFVLATQNPIELEGAYLLPEAQLDRFLFNTILDYLTADEEMQVVDLTTTTKVAHADTITSAEEIMSFQQLVRMTPIGESVARHAADMVRDAPAGRKRSRVREEVCELWRQRARGAIFSAGGQGPGADARPLSRDIREHPGIVYSGAAAQGTAELPCGKRQAAAGRYFEDGVGG